MKPNIVVVGVGASLLLLCAPVPGAPVKLLSADETAAFKAAGFKLKGKRWRACDDPTPTYSPGAIQEVRDLNGDGQPEVIITEGGTFCYGNAGVGYSVVSKQANGSWKLITNGTGVINLLTIKGAGGWPDIEIGGPGFCFPVEPGGWPDIEIGGPGFCFPVERWNGRQYVLHRHQYEGKPCRRK